MKNFIITLLSAILMILATIAVMIYGWGLEPKSWWWIIGCGIFIRLLIALTETIGKESKD